MKSIPGLLLIITLFSFLSCGSDDDDDDAVNQQEQEQTPSIGEFTAQLIPVNPAIVSNPSSTNNIRIVDNQVSASLSVSGLSAGTNQKQHIHIGRSCPSIADDTNQDGFVDGVESLNRTGGVLIPLDGDLNSQSAGNSFSPVTNANGSYQYFRSGSLSNLLADLTIPDTNTSDEFIKLDSGDALNIEGAVLEIHGIPTTVILPATVAGLPGETPHASFPVGCGLLQQVPGGSTTGGATGGTTGGGDEEGLSCRLELQILCPTGQLDGCVTGQTKVHRCVTPSPVACSQDLQILCPNGLLDGCDTGQTTTHRCVRPNAVSCDIELQIMCPAGFRDGCETGQTHSHRCVRQANPSCNLDILILCPPGFRDGCESGQSTTHRCVRQNEVSCMEDLLILCPWGFRDGCDTGQTTTHRCVRQSGVSCNVEIAILCPTGFSDGCLNGRSEIHQCIRDAN